MVCERIHLTRRGKHFLYAFPDALRNVPTNTADKPSPVWILEERVVAYLLAGSRIRNAQVRLKI